MKVTFSSFFKGSNEFLNHILCYFVGNTIGQIASHKAGIFKHQIPAFTVPQVPEAMDVLHENAQELM
uniref:Uncharacterized protein n=1 Tax=Salix viminalis TaxID=40686 RepID=A0A6N2MAT9_SALVM